MKLTINGKKHSLTKCITVMDLIVRKKLDHKSIVIEYNGKILSKKQISTTRLKENDLVEIISFVGGG